jgi:hypothetical protein
LQTSPSDTACFFFLCHRRFPLCFASATAAHRRCCPPERHLLLGFPSTRRPIVLLPFLIPFAGLLAECHDVLALLAPPERRPLCSSPHRMDEALEPPSSNSWVHQYCKIHSTHFFR